MGLPPSPQPPTTPAPLSDRPARVVLRIGLGVIWFGVAIVAGFLGFLMFAFADAPGAGAAAQLMIVPFFGWLAFIFIASAILIWRGRVWQIVVAFVLAISPPFLIFAGYNLLSGRSSGAGVTPIAGPPATAPVINMPPGGFV